MERYLSSQLQQHYVDHRQMIFLSGPRQVGKTTLARSFVSDIQGSHYFNWDNHNHRVMINSGPEEVARDPRVREVYLGENFRLA